MKHLGISGGGTKIAGLFGIAESIIYDRGYKPDIISGISAGAILALPLALDKRQEILDLVFKFDLQTFFNVPPVKRSGKVRVFNALSRMVRGKHSLGEQDNLEKIIAKVITETEFEEYVKDDSKAICIVGSVDFYTGKRFYINLKSVTYNQFLKFVNASASIPIFTEGVEMENEIIDFEGKLSPARKVLLYDGGVRDHSPSHKILSSEHADFQVTETCTIFSRPENLREIIHPNTFHPTGILKVLDRYTEITNAEISKNDAAQEKVIIAQKGIIDHGTFYLPRVMEGFYDVNEKRLRELYEKAKACVNDETWKDG